MKTSRYATVLSAALLPLFIAVLSGSSCKKDETETPTAVPTPPPAPSPTPVATVMPEEDAGSDAADAGDADADAAKPGPAVDTTGIKKCCAALRQNAKSAPPDQQAGYLAAASACDGLVATQQSRNALSGLRSFLRGANLPAGCQ